VAIQINMHCKEMFLKLVLVVVWTCLCKS